MKPTVEVTEANFENEVLKSEEIASESVNCLKVARVKLDRSPNLGLWYGIRCIPTMLCFVDGEERIGIFGATSKSALLSQLKPIISSRHMLESSFARFNQQ